MATKNTVAAIAGLTGRTVAEVGLTTYRPPFRGDTQQILLQKHISEKPAPPTLYNPDLTPEFSSLVLKCLEKKRDDRPHS